LNKDCKLGVILGTGFNISYLENNCSRIEKWNEERLAKYKDVKNVIIDVECGAFGDNGCIDFVKTDIDLSVDADSLFPKSFSFEKLFSGKFMGDIVRRIFKELVKQGILCNGKVTKELETQGILRSSVVQAVDNDETTKEAESAMKILGYSNGDYNVDDFTSLKYICRVITVRCACLVSSLFAAIIDWLNEPNTVIAIDGSLYKNHTLLKKLLRDYTAELTGRTKKFDLILAHDGSGEGGALCCAAQSKRIKK